MSCYLCAYGRKETPEDLQALPDDSIIGAKEDLGTCSTCSVWACSSHGTRYGAFECAICTPGSAVASAFGVTGSGAAETVAHLVGMGADSSLVERVGVASQRVVEDSHAPAQTVDDRSLAAPRQGEPNLITNLAEAFRREHVIRREYDDAEAVPWLTEGFVPAVNSDGERFGFVLIDAIGGAVRARFAGRTFTTPTDEAVTTLTGALLLGYSLAESTISARRRESSFGWGAGIDRLPPPWQVSYPIFLDPALWMLGTALPA